MVHTYIVCGFYATVKKSDIAKIPACKEFVVVVDDEEYSTGVLRYGGNEIVYLGERDDEPGVSRVNVMRHKNRIDMMFSMMIRANRCIHLHCDSWCEYLLKTPILYTGKVVIPTPLAHRLDCVTRRPRGNVS